MNLEDLTCPICLDFPHNSVLLKCAYFEKGCRPFICDAPQTLSNCLERFKIAHGMQGHAEIYETRELVSTEGSQSTSVASNGQLKCPLCRGDVLECIVVEETREYLNQKMRSCQDCTCSYSGNFIDMQEHIKLSHPHAQAIIVDPIKLSEWEHVQQSSEFRDVLSILHSEEHDRALLGDYIVEYGDSGGVDEYVDFPGDEGECWTSALLDEVFNSFSTFRNQRITSVPGIMSDYGRQNSVTLHGDAGSAPYANTQDDVINDSTVTMPTYASARRSSNNHRSQRRRLNSGFTWHC